MAVNLVSAGGLMVKLGHIGGILLDTNYLRGVSSPAPPSSPDSETQIATKFGTLIADYAAGTAQYAIIQGGTSAQGLTANQSAQAALLAWQTANDPIFVYLQALAQATLIDAVNADQNQPDKSLATAIKALINNTMTNGGAYKLTASSVSVGNQTNGSPTPNGAYSASGNSGPVVVVSLKDGKGYGLDYALPETLDVICTTDAVSGSATKWSETLTVKGQANLSRSTLDWLWPSGSGASITLPAVDANLNNQTGGGNILQNSEFVTASTSNYVDNWVILVGSAGSTVKQAATGYLDSTCLQFASDGSTLISVCQPFNTATSTTAGAGGTPYNLPSKPDQPFAVNLFYKLASGTPAAGVLSVDLIDGSGSVIADDAGTNNAFTKTLSTVTDTSWHVLNGVFRLPIAPPTTPVKLRIRLSTALDNSNSIYIDRVGMAPMRQLYGVGAGATTLPNAAGVAGGPFVAAFSGNLQTLAGDLWTLAVSNTWGNFQQLLHRLFNLTGLGIRFPTSGGGSAIDDTVGSGHLIS